MVTDVLRRTVPSAELERTTELEYGGYRQLCGPKHASPVIQRGFGTRITEKGVEIVTGPELHTEAVRAAWFVIESGIRLAAIAARAFALAHLTPEDFEAVRAEYEAVVAERRRLAEKAIERGWGA
jgi:hypothetical protein